MVTLDAADQAEGFDRPRVRALRPEDEAAVSALLDRTGGRVRIRRGTPVDAAGLSGLVCVTGTTVTGLLTWRRRESELEILVLAAEEFDDRSRAELLAAVPTVVGPGGGRVVAVVDNADMAGQRSLQLAGFTLGAVRPGSVARGRNRLAPGRIPESYAGLPLRDELEYELQLR